MEEGSSKESYLYIDTEHKADVTDKLEKWTYYGVRERKEVGYRDAPHLKNIA